LPSRHRTPRTAAATGRPETVELDAASWTGLTLALACVYAPPDDLDLHIRLIGTGVQHAGNHLEEAISRLLDRASQDRLAVYCPGSHLS